MYSYPLSDGDLHICSWDKPAAVLTPMYIWLILVFGEALKTTDRSAMLLQNDVAGGGKQCRFSLGGENLPHINFLLEDQDVPSEAYSLDLTDGSQ